MREGDNLNDTLSREDDPDSDCVVFKVGPRPDCVLCEVYYLSRTEKNSTVTPSRPLKTDVSDKKEGVYKTWSTGDTDPQETLSYSNSSV